MRLSAEGASFDRHQSAPDYARGAGLRAKSACGPAHMVCTARGLPIEALLTGRGHFVDNLPYEIVGGPIVARQYLLSSLLIIVIGALELDARTQHYPECTSSPLVGHAHAAGVDDSETVNCAIKLDVCMAADNSPLLDPSQHAP